MDVKAFTLLREVLSEGDSRLHKGVLAFVRALLHASPKSSDMLRTKCYAVYATFISHVDKENNLDSTIGLLDTQLSNFKQNGGTFKFDTFKLA